MSSPVFTSPSQPQGAHHPGAPSPTLVRTALTVSRLFVILGAIAFYYASSRTSAHRNQTAAISVTIDHDGCVPNDITVRAGRSTFAVVNKSNRAIEFEILDGVMVVEERENIAPGFIQDVTARLDAGTYEITCGLLNKPRAKLHVTTSAEAKSQPARLSLRAFIGPLAEYQFYLNTQVAKLMHVVDALEEAAKSGDLDDAKRLYLEARALFGQVASVAVLFAETGDLSGNSERGAVDNPSAFGVLRTVRHNLFDQATTSGVPPVIEELAANVANLDKRLADFSITPDRLAAGTASLLDRDASSGPANCSQVDLADAAADFEGVNRVLALLRPLFERASASQAVQIDADASAIAVALADFRTSQTDITSYQCGLIRDRLRALARAVRRVDVALGSG
jgi:iron uptake system component EfeO